MKIKCKICGCEFNPIIEKHYISRDEGTTGLAIIVRNEEEKLYDTFDCPECGCQVIAQERKRVYVNLNADVDDEEEVEDDG